MQPNSQLKAQSSIYGKIEQLLIVFPGDPAKVSRKSICRRFCNIFMNFGDRVTFIVLSNYDKELDKSSYLEVSERFSAAFRDALSASHLHPDHHMIHIPAPMTLPWKEIEGLEAHYNHSDFIQDPFIVLQNAYGESVLMESYRSLNPKNQYVAEQVAAATGMLLRPTALWVEGGNVLIGNDFALIGKDLLYHNLELLYPGKGLHEEIGGNSANTGTTPYDSITGMFKRQLGIRYLMWIGMEKPLDLEFSVDQGKYRLQPFFHLDLYLTLAGMTQSGEELVLVGKIDSDYVEGPVEMFRDDLIKLNGMLTEVENQLRRSGNTEAGPKFEFQELPMGGKIAEDENGYRFVPFSYNNCHVEWYHGIKRIYMPRYPQTVALEDEILSDLVGKKFPPFQFINYDLDEFAEDGGSLHCLTKVLKRSAY